MKITKKKPKRNSRDEKVPFKPDKSDCQTVQTPPIYIKCVALNLRSSIIQVALNEVFVLAAMMKHRHVVR